MTATPLSGPSIHEPTRLRWTFDNGSSATYDPRRLRGVNVYRETTREFATGDRIQFTAPDRNLGVANRDLGTVTSLENGKIAVRLDGKEERTVSFDPKEYRQFDHVLALYSAERSKAIRAFSTRSRCDRAHSANAVTGTSTSRPKSVSS